MSNEEKKWEYLKIELDDIIKYCQENDEVKWLKETAAQKVDVKVYPKKKVTRVREDGTTYKTMVADKDKPYTIEKKPITFIQLKRAFCEKFMKEIIPVAEEEKKPTMWDIIKAL